MTRPVRFRAALVALNVMALLAIAFVVHAEHGRNGPPVVVDRARYLKGFNDMLWSLEKIDERNAHNPQKKNRRVIGERVESMRRDLLAMREELYRAPIPSGPVGFPVPAPVPSTPVAMTEAEFQDVLRAYRSAYYTSQKYVVLQEVGRANWFTTEQVIRVLNETYWNTDKVKAGALLYPRVVDERNWYKVYAALYWESDREELRRLTAGMQN